MIQIDDKIISLELFTARFRCDLRACRGICCVDGSSGAPLEVEDAELLRSQWPHYAPYVTPRGRRAIEEQGFAILDEDGDLTTPLIDGAECAYTTSENGITWCAVEKAWSEGRTTYRKPISCHLYPIRLVSLPGGLTGLQYHRWDICRAAETLGLQHGEPLYRTLREPLVRRFGERFYEIMQECEAELSE